MTTYSEAPCSFNIKAFSPGGFDIMLTLRSDDGGELMPRALAALKWLQDNGFAPSRTNGYSRQPAANGTTGPAAGQAPTCPVHGTEMKVSKHGSGFFCPTKVADDDGTGKPVYCKQRIGG